MGFATFHSSLARSRDGQAALGSSSANLENSSSGDNFQRVFTENQQQNLAHMETPTYERGERTTNKREARRTGKNQKNNIFNLKAFLNHSLKYQNQHLVTSVSNTNIDTNI